jgi:hypothetical protein
VVLIYPCSRKPDGNIETVRLVRAFNVLRQYDEADLAEAYGHLAIHVLPEGLLIEGTSDPFGRLWVANLLRMQTNQQWQTEGLIFSVNFHAGSDSFTPGDFQPVLPKNHIHRMVSGEPIYHFFQDWKQAAAETSPMRSWGLRQWFSATACQLAGRGYQIDLRSKWLRYGWLIWQNPPRLMPV